MKNKYDVCVAGCWYLNNYGSILNGYATFKLIESLGYKPLNLLTPNNVLSDTARKTMRGLYADGDFSDTNTFDGMKKYNKACDTFLTGSDQIWHYNGQQNKPYEEYFRLSFVDDEKKKISFATSFGNTAVKPPESVEQDFARLVKRYDRVSVREMEAADICKNVYGVTPTLLVDPTITLGREAWERIAARSASSVSEPYALAYILDPSEEKRKIIEDVKRVLHINAVCLTDNRASLAAASATLPNPLPSVAIDEFLDLFRKASYVVTDSYHGTIFSIIFNKNFVATANAKRGNDRFSTLLRKVALTDRWLAPSDWVADERFFEKIDYLRINEVVEDEREFAVDWLKTALKLKK